MRDGVDDGHASHGEQDAWWCRGRSVGGVVRLVQWAGQMHAVMGGRTFADLDTLDGLVYTTPVLATGAGVEQLVSLDGEHLRAFDGSATGFF